MPKGVYVRTSKNNKGCFKKGIYLGNGKRTQFKKGMTPWNKGKGELSRGKNNPFYGKKHSKETIEKNRLVHLGNTYNKGKKHPEMTGENHFAWKGDDAGYHALHSWVIRNLGQPDTCESCGKSGLKGRRIHWANKDHSYKRNLNDWMRLCVSCHKIYDIKNNLKYVYS